MYKKLHDQIKGIKATKSVHLAEDEYEGEKTIGIYSEAVLAEGIIDTDSEDFRKMTLPIELYVLNTAPLLTNASITGEVAINVLPNGTHNIFITGEYAIQDLSGTTGQRNVDGPNVVSQGDFTTYSDAPQSQKRLNSATKIGTLKLNDAVGVDTEITSYIDVECIKQ